MAAKALRGLASGPTHMWKGETMPYPEFLGEELRLSRAKCNLWLYRTRLW